MKKLKGLILTVALLFVAVFAVVFAINYTQAATSQDVSVNATPAFMSISNAPTGFDFGVVSENSSENTSLGYFTVTNTSTIPIDIAIECDNWTSVGSSWTYGAPAPDTANFDASSADGGTGGSTGAGDFDISILAYSGALICDNVTASANVSWEIELDAPTAFTHGDVQQNTVTLTATAE